MGVKEHKEIHLSIAVLNAFTKSIHPVTFFQQQPFQTDLKWERLGKIWCLASLWISQEWATHQNVMTAVQLLTDQTTVFQHWIVIEFLSFLCCSSALSFNFSLAALYKSFKGMLSTFTVALMSSPLLPCNIFCWVRSPSTHNKRLLSKNREAPL